MTNFLCIKVIFRYFLYFLTPKAVDILIERCWEEPDTAELARSMTRLFQANVKALYDLVAREGDEEDTVAYLNVFLWRQKYGDINQKLRIRYDFSSSHNAWLIHRCMIANGYEGIEHMRLRPAHANVVSTYAEEIAHSLDVFHASHGFQAAYGHDYDDDFTSLATYLTVIGPTIEQHPRLAEIRIFFDYIVRHWKDNERLVWLPPALFTMMAYDLQYEPAYTWPLYQFLLPRVSIFDYHALLLGIRMYGDLARLTLQHHNIPGGYALLDTLASR
jgi:hypothetical protein